MSDVTKTPDDAMGQSIDSLVFWVCRLLSRAQTLTCLSEEECEALNADYYRKEEDLRHAYIVALRARAAEVVAYAKANGIDGMTQDRVRQEPFLMVAAIGKVQGHFEEDER